MPSTTGEPLATAAPIRATSQSTLAAELARRWSAALYSKDALKDFLAETMPEEPDPAWLSREANELLWYLAGRSERCVLETWFGSADGLDRVRSGLAGSGIPTRSVCEIWCEVPLQVARDRFLARARHDPDRHPRHLQAGADERWWDGLAGAGPLGIGRVQRVATTSPLSDADYRRLLRAAASQR